MLGMLRRDEARNFSSRCQITRAGEGTLNETTGVFEGASDLLYEGECLVLAAHRDFRRVDFGGDQRTLHMYDVKLPLSVMSITEGDILTVTSSADPGLTGRHLVIRDIPYDEWRVSRNLVAEEVR